MKKTWSKKWLAVFVTLAMVLALMSVASFTASAEKTLIYEFTFENGGDTILVRAGEPVGEIVEWPVGSGNHALKYQLNSTTWFGCGCHPFIWPEGFTDILRAQSVLSNGEYYELTLDIANTGNTQGSYMYPFLLCNGDLDDENYFDKSSFTPSGRFQTHTWTLSRFEAGYPLPGADGEHSGGISFVDEFTLDNGSYMYLDNIKFSKVGSFNQPSAGAGVAYRDGTPAEGGITGTALPDTSDTSSAEPSTEPSTEPWEPTASDQTLIYRFTFEGAGDTILVKGGENVGEIVEWPVGSGNHALRYQLNSTTWTGAGVHPYIWPQGINDILVAQGDLAAGESYQLTIDMAYSGNTSGTYIYPFMLCNGEMDDENYFDRYFPTLTNSFSTYTWTMSEFGGGYPGRFGDNYTSGGIAFVDELTLVEGNYMYIDNVTLVKNGVWKDVPASAAITYRNGVPAEAGLVTSSGAGTYAKLTAENKEAFAGHEFTVNVDLSDNPGIAYLKLAVDYNTSAFELVSAENAELLDGSFMTSKTTAVRPYMLQWLNASDSDGSGRLVTLTFRAKENAAVGNYRISLKAMEAYNENYETVFMVSTGGNITLKRVVVGDLNGDGVINGKDGILCAQALAGWDVTYYEFAADVTGDGTFNGKDGILLSQYLAGWDVVLG